MGRPDGFKVRVIGPRQPKLRKDADAPLIVLCKKITLGDGHPRPLPLLLLDLYNDETSVVIAADAEQPGKLPLGSPMWPLICGQAVRSANERGSGLWDRDWIDPDDDHAVDWGEVKSNLCVEITALYARPELLAAHCKYHQISAPPAKLTNLPGGALFRKGMYGIHRVRRRNTQVH